MWAHAGDNALSGDPTFHEQFVELFDAHFRRIYRILDRISETLKRSYTRQRIAIEGHTDNSPLYGGAFSTNHQLAAAQSNAVLEHFTRRNQMPVSQLFTLNHGDNYPVADNQSPANRSTNRRIEFVIYPETF